MNSKEKTYLLLGPLLCFGLIWLNPFQLEHNAAGVLGVVLWMLLWWITEVVPMAVTALLPIIIFPMMGIMTLEKTCLSYSNRFVFLFLGGFLIALAMEKWNLHRRLALSIVHKTGTSADRIIFGFLAASYLISMWISNTATTLMMLPIGYSVVKLLVSDNADLTSKGVKNFSMTLMLCIAYGSSIGGIATLVGSPPNASMAGILDKSFDTSISFFDWMKIGLPFSVLLLLISYLLLVKVIFPNRLGKFDVGKDLITEELQKLGRWADEEKKIFFLFILTACLWIVQGPVSQLIKPLNIEFTDTTIALIAGCILFLIPSRSNPKKFILEWRDTEKLPWGVLLMFGGGMSLAEAFSTSGLVDQITGAISQFETSNLFLFVSLLCAVGLVLTALMSNIAMVNLFVPVVASLAIGIGQSPESFAIPVTIAASCDFMLPMSTPPNAIVYSSGYIKSKDMLKAGFVLNVISLILLMMLVWIYV